MIIKNFTSVADVQDIGTLLKDCIDAKNNPFADKNLGHNKTLGLIFLNPSFRTRMSTQKAASNLGLNCMVLNIQQDSWNLEFDEGVLMNGNTTEHVQEAASVISEYCDIVGLRSFPGLVDRERDYSEFVFQQFIRYCRVPIISLESATRHPLQSLADLMTIEENKSKNNSPKVVLCWAPHVKPLPQAVANSFCEWMQRTDAEFIISHPEGYELSNQFTLNTPIFYNQKEAIKNADFIYIKNWSQFEDYGKIEPEKHRDWMLTPEHLIDAPEAKIMHCLPVRRNVELHESLIHHNNSIVLAQAANREFAAQAVLKNILKGI